MNYKTKLAVKKISDLTVRAIQGIYATKNPTEQQKEEYKR